MRGRFPATISNCIAGGGERALPARLWSRPVLLGLLPRLLELRLGPLHLGLAFGQLLLEPLDPRSGICRRGTHADQNRKTRTTTVEQVITTPRVAARAQSLAAHGASRVRGRSSLRSARSRRPAASARARWQRNRSRTASFSAHSALMSHHQRSLPSARSPRAIARAEYPVKAPTSMA